MSPQLIEPQYRDIDGLRVRYARSQPRAQQALLLSPWPESIYCYQPTWPRLADQVELVAIDLPGFGQSEGRAELLSPKAMGEFMLHAADDFELERPHLVGPDVGTSTSLFAAAMGPHRFQSLVVGSGGAAVPLQLGGVVKEWVEAPSLEPYRGIGTAIVDAAMSTLERFTPSPQALADYRASYAGDRFAESMRFVQAYPEQLPLLADLLPAIETPTLIIAGARDPVVPAANAEFLHQRLPNSRLVVLDAQHFVWEDAGEEWGRFVTNWWAAIGQPSNAEMQS
jgi:pimeloyl-ACP methyl ester carboxylesterase